VAWIGDGSLVGTDKIIAGCFDYAIANREAVLLQFEVMRAGFGHGQ
jgi:hypothetical protein